MSRFSKFDQFFSVQSTETPRLRITQRIAGNSEDRLGGTNPFLSRERRSYSIENTLKLIKQKEDIQTRVSDFLASKKLGLLTQEQTKELKQLKNYNEGNRTKEETMVFLKQLKKEQDEFVVKNRQLQEQCTKLEQATKKIREKLQQAADAARFTQETAVRKQKEFDQLQFATETALYQSQVLQQMIARSKEHNIWLKGRLVEARQINKTKQLKLQSLWKSSRDEQKKAGDESILAEQFQQSLRQSSVELMSSFHVAQQTIDSKSQLLKQMFSNEQLKQQAARQYEMKYLSDKKLWKQLRVHRFYSLLLNYKHFRLEETNAPMETAFAVVKMRTAIKDPILFWNSYFQSSRTYEQLKERAKLLEEKQQKLEATNRKLTDEYISLVLETASRQNPVGLSFNNERQPVPLSTYEHIDNATDTLSKVTLWASRVQYKLRPLLKKRSEVEAPTSKNQLLIRMFLEVVQEHLLARS